ncbi:unnamed protein product [Lupinus luteus]|uniref:Uncharacterized protein n=1 Tax=Lupinus luteus TaxID=3873 RepID=A0AAV1Y3G7_LUPLU
MDSSSTQRHQDHKLVPKQCETFFKYLSSHKTPSSFSSCSSFSPPSSSFGSLYFANDTILSPTTPHRFSGVPFSWEHLPGIPKNQNSKKQESSFKLLPLPPPTTKIHSCKKLNHDDETRIRKKNSIQSTSQRDPFFDAMVKCSKDDHEEEKSIRDGTISVYFDEDKVVELTFPFVTHDKPTIHISSTS